MSRLDALLHNYARQVALPWEASLAGPQRVWFVVYDPADERRVRARVNDFELRTRQAGHGWLLRDLDDAFAVWMAARKYRDEYFAAPEHLHSALADFHGCVVQQVRAALTQPAAEGAVVAVLGVGSLFGFLRVADVVQDVEKDIRGRLLVFFPGEYDKNNYRLLDARDGWNYLAIPITSSQGAGTA